MRACGYSGGVPAGVTTEFLPDYALVTISGEVAIAIADDVALALREATADGRVVVDLRKTTFMGSTGVNLLVAAYNAVRRRNGWLRLVYDGDPVARVLRITGLIDLLPAYDSVAAAAGDG